MPAGVRVVWDTLATEASTYLVGGAVRDLVRGVAPHDWDLATALAPERVAARLADRGFRVIPTGLAFGTVTVLTAGGLGVEVTTFRQDGRYRDGRHPQLVTFTTDLATDLARRDFTVNALAMDRDGAVVDEHGGLADLALRRLRMVGDPAARLQEDPLRMWRAVRLTALGTAEQSWSLDPTVQGVIADHRRWLVAVSVERQRDELMKLLAAPDDDGRLAALTAANDLRLLDLLWPAWTATRGFDQRHPRHAWPLDGHLMRTAVAGPTPFLRLVGLVHDIAKPQTQTVGSDGVAHYYDHDTLGARFVAEMLRTARFSAAETRYAADLVGAHMFPWDEAKGPGLRRAVRRWGLPMVEDLLTLHGMDVAGQDPHATAWVEETKVRHRVREAHGALPTAGALAIDGHTVMGLRGWPPGPRVGACLAAAWAWVEDEPARNTGADLRAFVERWEP